MFENTKVFTSFAVDDIPTAREFYRKTLGVKLSDEDDMLVLHTAGDRDVLVYPKPDFTPATYTVLNFQVDDIDKAVDELVARGIRFEKYESFEHDEKGICRGEEQPDIAWFKDPAGNIHSVIHFQK